MEDRSANIDYQGFCIWVREYISGFFWVPQRKQLVQGPSDTLDPFLLVLLGIFGREGTGCDIWPVISKIEVEQPQISQEKSNVRRSRSRLLWGVRR